MGLSMGHLILILLIAVVFFGPSRLPNLGRSLGEAIRGFKSGLEGADDPQQKRLSESDDHKS
jgi:sec-independent protein translocase protein TatA